MITLCWQKTNARIPQSLSSCISVLNLGVCSVSIIVLFNDIALCFFDELLRSSLMTLSYATLATVSRCGMSWLSDDVLSTQMICRHFLDQLKETPIESDSGVTPDEEAEVIAIQSQVACSIEEFFTEDGLVVKCLEYAFELNHIMEPA